MYIYIYVLSIYLSIYTSMCQLTCQCHLAGMEIQHIVLPFLSVAALRTILGMEKSKATHPR